MIVDKMIAKQWLADQGSPQANFKHAADTKIFDPDWKSGEIFIRGPTAGPFGRAKRIFECVRGTTLFTYARDVAADNIYFRELEVDADALIATMNSR